MTTPIKAVVFDAYGTIVQIADKRDPYRRLLSHAVPGKILPLRSRTSLGSIAQALGNPLSKPAMQRLEDDLAAELASVRAFDDVEPVWTELRKRGIRIGVCSNLATPYIEPVLDALPFPPNEACWSCECGTAKPDPLIYRLMCARLHVHTAEAIMVGDNLTNDVKGPIKAGLRAIHLNRSTTISTGNTSGSLYDLLCITQR